MARIIRKLLNLPAMLKKCLYRMLYRHVRWGKGLRFFGCPILRFSGEVCLGDNVTFTSSTRSNFVGICKPCSVCVPKGGKLTIGHHSGFSGVSIFCKEQITIGDHCLFGGNCSIWDTDFHPLDIEERRKPGTKGKSAPIMIGNDVFVGAYSIILKGVTIGDGAIIGAASVVSKSIPPGEIWAGNPAKKIR